MSLRSTIAVCISRLTIISVYKQYKIEITHVFVFKKVENVIKMNRSRLT